MTRDLVLNDAETLFGRTLSTAETEAVADFALECLRRREIEIADELAALFGTMSAVDDTKQYTFEQNFRKYIDILCNPADDGSTENECEFIDRIRGEK